VSTKAQIKGNSFEDAIVEGKRRGFVEADPSMDIDGWDAAAKTAALVNVLMDGGITPLDISREGIQNITYNEIQEAEKNGKVIKLVCRGWTENDKAYGEVKPVSISKEHIFAGITGTSSIISLTTDLMGEVTIVEKDPEIEQTGYGLFSDLMRLIRHI
jgi:homoserine dehydrogenase